MCLTASAQVKYVSTNAQKLNVEQLQDQSKASQVSRYFFAGYNTLCLPMSMSAEQLSEAAPGLTVERLMAIRQEGSVLNLYFADCTASGIEAGVPYLVFSPKAQYLRVRNTDATAINTKLQTIRMSDHQGNQVAFSSSWNSRQKEGFYGIPAKQNVTVLESVLTRTNGQTFLPTRCGIYWEQQSATATNIDIKHGDAPGNTTAIKALSTVQGTFDVYNLKGALLLQQVTAEQAKHQLTRGVYVVGGEKVIIK